MNKLKFKKYPKNLHNISIWSLTNYLRFKNRKQIKKISFLFLNQIVIFLIEALEELKEGRVFQLFYLWNTIISSKLSWSCYLRLIEICWLCNNNYYLKWFQKKKHGYYVHSINNQCVNNMLLKKYMEGRIGQLDSRWFLPISCLPIPHESYIKLILIILKNKY